MLRSNWDFVSPFSWLDSLADEEEFMGGFDKRYPSMRLLFLSRPQTAQHEDEPMTAEHEEEEEAMETEESPVVEEHKMVISDFFDDLPVGAKLMDTQVPQ